MKEGSGATEVMDQLLVTLEAVAGQVEGRPRSGDAIDRVLRSPSRETRLQSLKNAPEVAAFREALVDGLIRADTANQLLGLVNTIVTRYLSIGTG